MKKEFKTFLELGINDYFFIYEKKKLTKIKINQLEITNGDLMTVNGINFIVSSKQQAQVSGFFSIVFSDEKKALKTIRTKNKTYWKFLKIKWFLERRRF